MACVLRRYGVTGSGNGYSTDTTNISGGRISFSKKIHNSLEPHYSAAPSQCHQIESSTY
jgi:hypothetical protein